MKHDIQNKLEKLNFQQQRTLKDLLENMPMGNVYDAILTAVLSEEKAIDVYSIILDLFSSDELLDDDDKKLINAIIADEEDHIATLEKIAVKIRAKLYPNAKPEME